MIQSWIYQRKLQMIKKTILEYIHKHLDDCNIENLEWLRDLEPDKAVTMADIRN